ncbi:MAG: PHP domain-containing protein [Candidatus Cloacimonetes bacterium]|nr:PHP domain-containing protein [Candidatus Cloacimonadota bacterium]
MRNYRADLHIHSVLSPCGGLEMSPLAVTQRLKELGIEWFAITDHNSMANCPAFEALAKKSGLAFTWGVEIQTIEEIHLLAYFDDSDKARAFDEELYRSLLPIDNDPDFFGDQVVVDENENIIRMETRALINSSSWELDMAVNMVQSFDGFAIPAHVDAEINSIISQHGVLPPSPEVPILGITAGLDLESFLGSNPGLAGKSFMRASDAHYLNDLRHETCIIRVLDASVSELIKAAQELEGRLIIDLGQNE